MYQFLKTFRTLSKLAIAGSVLYVTSAHGVWNNEKKEIIFDTKEFIPETTEIINQVNVFFQHIVEVKKINVATFCTFYNKKISDP